MPRSVLLFIAFLFCTVSSLPAQKKSIFVTASFLGKSNLFLEDLTREEIRIWESGQPREVAYFAGKEVAPAYGLLFDRNILPLSFEESRSERTQVSSSMAANSVALQILDKSLNGQVGWVGVYDKGLQMAVDYTGDTGRIKNVIQMLRGQNAREPSYLYAALFNGAQKLSRRNEKRRILIVFLNRLDWDTGEKLKPLKNLFGASNVELFLVSFTPRSNDDSLGLPTYQSEASLRDLGSVTAGGAFPSSIESIESLGRRIANQIRAMYTLGFESESKSEQPASFKIECTRPGVKIATHPIIPNLQ